MSHPQCHTFGDPSSSVTDLHGPPQSSCIVVKLDKGAPSIVHSKSTCTLYTPINPERLSIKFSVDDQEVMFGKQPINNTTTCGSLIPITDKALPDTSDPHRQILKAYQHWLSVDTREDTRVFPGHRRSLIYTDLQLMHKGQPLLYSVESTPTHQAPTDGVGESVYVLPVPLCCLAPFAGIKTPIPWPCVGRDPPMLPGSIRVVCPKLPAAAPAPSITQPLKKVEDLLGRTFRFILKGDMLSGGMDALSHHCPEPTVRTNMNIKALSFAQLSGSGKTDTFIRFHLIHFADNPPRRVVMFPLGSVSGLSPVGKTMYDYLLSCMGKDSRRIWDRLIDVISQQVACVINETASPSRDPTKCAFNIVQNLGKSSPSSFRISRRTPCTVILFIDEAMILDHYNSKIGIPFGFFFVVFHQVLIEVAQKLMKQSSNVTIVLAFADTHSTVSNFEPGSHSGLLDLVPCLRSQDKKVLCSVQFTDSFSLQRHALLPAALMTEDDVCTSVLYNAPTCGIPCHSDQSVKDELVKWLVTPTAWFNCSPCELLSGVPLWTTAFLRELERILKAGGTPLIEKLNASLAHVIILAKSKVHRDFTEPKAIEFPTRERLRGALFGLVGHGLGTLLHRQGSDLVKASCGMLLPPTSCPTLSIEASFSGQCRVIMPKGKLYALASLLLFNSFTKNDEFYRALSDAVSSLVPFNAYSMSRTSKGTPMELVASALLTVAFATGVDLTALLNDSTPVIHSSILSIPTMSMGELLSQVTLLWEKMYPLHAGKGQSDSIKSHASFDNEARVSICGIVPSFRTTQHIKLVTTSGRLAKTKNARHPLWMGGMFLRGKVEKGADIELALISSAVHTSRFLTVSVSVSVPVREDPDGKVIEKEKVVAITRQEYYILDLEVKALKDPSLKDVAPSASVFLCFHPPGRDLPKVPTETTDNCNVKVIVSLPFNLPEWDPPVLSAVCVGDIQYVHQSHTSRVTISSTTDATLKAAQKSIIQNQYCFPSPKNEEPQIDSQ
eukprot:gnl/Dysnectes_brevis/2225_a2598_1088.p1 GENE.gnl/Dysnectes_brevis/2225_a2598_1088~~gnl/Dysnectes_brevis/2225_a2598_1088.p1  ORF type:complete len:1006 (+),score=166.52 gnl/Dysnectes_brevis/2225_a2598_1088:130-3147(+)